MINNLVKLPGGVGDNTHTDQVDPNQLSIGIQVEMEHTNDPDIAQEIAMDHLTEDPQYYTKLVKAGLASEFQPSHNSGFGDPDQSFNDAARTGHGGLKKGNMHGKIGGTSSGQVDGRNSEPIVNKTIDIELEDREYSSLEEAILDEKKRRKKGGKKRKPKPTNPSLWARAKAAARSKFDVYPCVPLDSKALTKNGWKTYEELTIGELILTYNINKDELEWKPILNLNFFENAELVRMYKPTGFSIKCTPNHKWVVQRGNDYSIVELMETKDLPKRARIIVCAELKNNDKILLETFSKTDNWTENIINMSSEQRKSFLAATIIYDGWDKGSSSKIEGRHTFGFVQKNSDHLDAGLLAAYLSGYYVSVHDREYIASASFIRNKKFHSVQNIKFEKTENEDVWCPTTENNTWVMYQNGLITITGNSAYANGWAARWYKQHGGGWRMSENIEVSKFMPGSPTMFGSFGLPDKDQASIDVKNVANVLKNKLIGGAKELKRIFSEESVETKEMLSILRKIHSKIEVTPEQKKKATQQFFDLLRIVGLAVIFKKTFKIPFSSEAIYIVAHLLNKYTGIQILPSSMVSKEVKEQGVVGQVMDSPFPADVAAFGSGTNGSGYDFVGYAESKNTMNKQQLKEAIKRMIREIEQDDVEVGAEDDKVTITLDRELAQKLHDLLMTQLTPSGEDVEETPAGPEDSNAVVPSEDDKEAVAANMSSDQLPIKSNDVSDEESVDEITFEESEAIGEAKKKWIQQAIGKPGALHKQLGVPSSKKIPAGKLTTAAKKGGKLGQRARLALTLRKLKKK